jgi:hypothetical protein
VLGWGEQSDDASHSIKHRILLDKLKKYKVIKSSLPHRLSNIELVC